MIPETYTFVHQLLSKRTKKSRVWSFEFHFQTPPLFGNSAHQAQCIQICKGCSGSLTHEPKGWTSGNKLQNIKICTYIYIYSVRMYMYICILSNGCTRLLPVTTKTPERSPAPTLKAATPFFPMTMNHRAQASTRPAP